MRQAGEVTYADAHKRERNMGIVDFASHSDMKAALEKLDNQELHGRRIKLREDKTRRRRYFLFIFVLSFSYLLFSDLVPVVIEETVNRVLEASLFLSLARAPFQFAATMAKIKVPNLPILETEANRQSTVLEEIKTVQFLAPDLNLALVVSSLVRALALQ